MSWSVLEGDCREVMAVMESESVDAIVTDPPAGIGFMGRSWDQFREARSGKGNAHVYDRTVGQYHSKPTRADRTAFVAFMVEAADQMRRVLKPGAHAFVWGIPRTAHWTAWALEDAGFEIRDVVTHLFGSGFPKSRNLGDGWGTALKPGAEFWILARAPLARSSVTANHAEYGTGGLNVDGCRLDGLKPYREAMPKSTDPLIFQTPSASGTGTSDIGRWPPNVAMDEEAARALDEAVGERAGHRNTDDPPPGGWASDGVTGWKGRPAVGYSDTGGPSRFFYVAKADRRERDVGMDGGSLWGGEEIPVSDARKWNSGGIKARRDAAGLGQARNVHPTVKPIALMRWLCRLVTPPGGLVLDPFAGSGTTGIAALAEGFSFIGIEREAEYVEIARRRIGAGAPQEART